LARPVSQDAARRCSHEHESAPARVDPDPDRGRFLAGGKRAGAGDSLDARRAAARRTGSARRTHRAGSGRAGRACSGVRGNALSAGGSTGGRIGGGTGSHTCGSAGSGTCRGTDRRFHRHTGSRAGGSAGIICGCTRPGGGRAGSAVA
jgi:hypothetical protein